jgi:hypothetical protein
MTLTFHDFDEMGSDASDQLSHGVVGGGCDAGLLEDLSAHVGVGDTEQELLLL